MIGNKYILNEDNISDICSFITNIEIEQNENLSFDFDNQVFENRQQVIEILKEHNKNQAKQIEQLHKLLEQQQILLLNEQKEKQILLEKIKESKNSFWSKLKFFKK